MKSEPESARVWSFDAIRNEAPARASLLSNSPTPSELSAAIGSKLESALLKGNAMFALEQAHRNPIEVRAVVQFRVGATLFDQFFNSTNGYRAQYRRSWQLGLTFNRLTIENLRAVLSKSSATNWSGRLLNADFDDIGSTEIPRIQVLESLCARLSKIWFCTRLVTYNSGVRPLASGVGGPRLKLDDGTTWAAPTREDVDSWLEAKGAFLTESGLWQPKDPKQRALQLEKTGEA